MFVNYFNLTLKRIYDRKETKIIWTLFFILSTINFVQACFTYEHFDMHALPAASLVWILNYTTADTLLLAIVICYFLPLLSSAVYSDSLMLDNRRGMSYIVALRGTKRSYICSTVLGIFCVCFAIIFLPLFMYQIAAYIVFPHIPPLYGVTASPYAPLGSELMSRTTLILKDLFIMNPFLYNLVRAVYLSIYAGILGVLTFALSIFIKTNRLVLLGLLTLVNLLSVYVVPSPFKPAMLLAPSLSMTNPPVWYWLLFPVVLGVITCLLLSYAIRRKELFL